MRNPAPSNQLRLLTCYHHKEHKADHASRVSGSCFCPPSWPFRSLYPFGQRVPLHPCVTPSYACTCPFVAAFLLQSSANRPAHPSLPPSRPVNLRLSPLVHRPFLPLIVASLNNSPTSCLPAANISHQPVLCPPDPRACEDVPNCCSASLPACAQSASYLRLAGLVLFGGSCRDLLHAARPQGRAGGERGVAGVGRG